MIQQINHDFLKLDEIGYNYRGLVNETGSTTQKIDNNYTFYTKAVVHNLKAKELTGVDIDTETIIGVNVAKIRVVSKNVKQSVLGELIRTDKEFLIYYDEGLFRITPDSYKKLLVCISRYKKDNNGN